MDKLTQRLIVDLTDMSGPGILELKPKIRGTISSGFDWICSWRPDENNCIIPLPAGAGKDIRSAIADWEKQMVGFFRHLKQGIKREGSRER